MDKFKFIRPDDFHVHLRDGLMLGQVFSYSNIFGKALVMGNLNIPVITGEDALDYYYQIMQFNPIFRPIMTIMFTNQTTPAIIWRANEMKVRVLKLIPDNTSTGSISGVPLAKLKDYYPVLAEAERWNMVFSGHWELATDPESGVNIPEEEREARAIPFLTDVISTFPKLRIVVEHVSTAAMVNLVKQASDNVAATITGHHLGPFHFGDVIKGGTIVNPFLYCKPVLKTVKDIKAVRQAAISGNPKFFFGSDSAPHPPQKKLTSPPAAGIFSAPTVLSHLFSVFYEEGLENRFEDFTAKFGSQFYGLPINKTEITIKKESWIVPKDYGEIVPFLAGQELAWKIVDSIYS